MEKSEDNAAFSVASNQHYLESTLCYLPFIVPYNTEIDDLNNSEPENNRVQRPALVVSAVSDVFAETNRAIANWFANKPSSGLPDLIIATIGCPISNFCDSSNNSASIVQRKALERGLKHLADRINLLIITTGTLNDIVTVACSNVIQQQSSDYKYTTEHIADCDDCCYKQTYTELIGCNALDIMPVESYSSYETAGERTSSYSVADPFHTRFVFVEESCDELQRMKIASDFSVAASAGLHRHRVRALAVRPDTKINLDVPPRKAGAVSRVRDYNKRNSSNAMGPMGVAIGATRSIKRVGTSSASLTCDITPSLSPVNEEPEVSDFLPIIGFHYCNSWFSLEPIAHYMKNDIPIVAFTDSTFSEVIDCLVWFCKCYRNSRSIFVSQAQKDESDAIDVVLKARVLAYMTDTMQNNNLTPDWVFGRMKTISLMVLKKPSLLSVCNVSASNLDNLTTVIFTAYCRHLGQRKWTGNFLDNVVPGIMTMLAKVDLPDLTNQFPIESYGSAWTHKIFENCLLIRPTPFGMIRLLLAKGIAAHEFLSLDQYANLFRSISDRTFFDVIVMGRLLGYSGFPADCRNFIFHDLNAMLLVLSGIGNMVPVNVMRNTLKNNCLGLSTDLRKSHDGLVIWAVLASRFDLAKVLWAFSPDPLPLALVLKRVLHELSRASHDWSHYETIFRGYSQEMGDLSLELFQKSADTCFFRTTDILTRPLDQYEGYSVLHLAYLSKHRKLVAHPLCQRYLRRKLFGSVRMVCSRVGFIEIPVWIKVTLCAALLVPIIFWVKYIPNGRKNTVLDNRCPTAAPADPTGPNHSSDSRNVVTRAYSAPLRSSPAVIKRGTNPIDHLTTETTSLLSSIVQHAAGNPNQSPGLEDTLNADAEINAKLPEKHVDIGMNPLASSQHRSPIPANTTTSRHVTESRSMRRAMSTIDDVVSNLNATQKTRTRGGRRIPQRHDTIGTMRHRTPSGQHELSCCGPRCTLKIAMSTVSSFYGSPICRFWLSLIFRCVHLCILAFTLSIPLCGDKTWDYVSLTFVLATFMESCWMFYWKRSKLSLGALHYELFDIFVSFVLMMLIIIFRFIADHENSFAHSVLYGRATLAGYMLYLSYSTIFTYAAMNKHLGTLVIRIRLMIMRDLLSFVILLTVVVLSNAIVIHAMVWPDVSDQYELWIRAMQRAWFTLFTSDYLNVISMDNDGCTRSTAMPGDMPYCLTASPYSDPKCSVVSWMSVFSVLQYMVIVKLIAYPVLIALFVRSNQEQSTKVDELWKYQLYTLVNDFGIRPVLPPPLTPLVIMYTLFIYYLTNCCGTRIGESVSGQIVYFGTTEKCEPPRRDYFQYWKRLCQEICEKACPASPTNFPDPDPTNNRLLKIENSVDRLELLMAVKNHMTKCDI